MATLGVGAEIKSAASGFEIFVSCELDRFKICR